MSLIFFIILMIIIGVGINFIFDYYFSECKQCKQRQLEDSLKSSVSINESLDDCMDELLND